MNLPVVLTIAGSDNSAGAGAQADLKTIILDHDYLAARSRHHPLWVAACVR